MKTTQRETRFRAERDDGFGGKSIVVVEGSFRVSERIELYLAQFRGDQFWRVVPLGLSVGVCLVGHGCASKVTREKDDKENSESKVITSGNKVSNKSKGETVGRTHCCFSMLLLHVDFHRTMAKERETLRHVHC